MILILKKWFWNLISKILINIYKRVKQRLMRWKQIKNRNMRCVHRHLSCNDIHLFAELECLYTPWADISPCTRTCGGGFKVQVRSFSLVPKGTPLAEDCDGDLHRNKTCNLNACEFHFIFRIWCFIFFISFFFNKCVFLMFVYVIVL